MNACILTIGDELLQGFTINTNSSWIAKTIEPYNIYIKKIITIGDEHNTIISETKKILNNDIDFLFVTGGLGPTHDDVTKKAFCKLFKDELIFDEVYYAYLQKLFINQNKVLPKINKSQAMIPKKASSMPNDMGSALGIYYFQKNIHIFIMPGVPNEMKNIVKNHIIPNYINTPPLKNHITIKTAGIMESVLSEKVDVLMKKYASTFSFAFLPHYNGVAFRIRPKNKSNNLEKVKNVFVNNMKPYAYGTDNDTLESALAQSLIKKNYSIATAESCTGGLISKRLTDTSGSSTYFIGGITAYSNKIKINLLDISKESLKKHGAVSEAIALEMAESIRKKMNSDIGISTTGISGPDGGNNKKPVGLVYIGVVTPITSIVKKYIFKVNRSIHREMVATAALNTTRILLEK
tara:strand:- start:53 stop:1273 length:1221 start_codon:yes stop_codon:yes gene_type:complete